jgi:sensor domain DACNV-containing protein
MYADTVNELAYPPARLVAPRILDHFQRLRAASTDEQRRHAPTLTESDIEALIDAAFWASLRREEGYVPRISLAFLPPEHAARPLTFDRRIPLEAEALTRMAPAVDRPGIHLGVWHDERGRAVWGTTRSVPSLCFVLEVAAPGVLVVKHSRGEDTGKFVNVAVLEGDQIKVLDERAARLPDCPSLLASLLGFDPPTPSAESINVLALVAVSMRAHGRGGSLLVVRPNSQAWRESIRPHIPYPVAPPYDELAELMAAPRSDAEGRVWRDAVRDSVDALAGLTAVDGATVMTYQFELLAFGAKIGRREGSSQVQAVRVAEPVEGDQPLVVHPTQLGGTRHQSAAQFVHDQHDALALVASVDGRFTIFAWSDKDQIVSAYRVQSLLL